MLKKYFLSSLMRISQIKVEGEPSPPSVVAWTLVVYWKAEFKKRKQPHKNRWWCMTPQTRSGWIPVLVPRQQPPFTSAHPQEALYSASFLHNTDHVLSKWQEGKATSGTSLCGSVSLQCFTYKKTQVKKENHGLAAEEAIDGIKAHE